MSYRVIGKAFESKLVAINRRRDGGSSRTWLYEGATPSIGGMVGSFLGQNLADLDYRRGDNVSQIAVTYDDVYPSQVDQPLVVSLKMNSVQKSCLEPPIDGAASILTDADILVIRKALKDLDNDPPTQADFGNDSSRYQAGLTVYYLMLRGYEFRTVHQPVFTKKLIATNLKRWATSFANVGRILSNATLIGPDEMPLSYAFRFGLPTPPPSNEWPSGFIYGWLKGPPEISQGAENIEFLTQSYDYGLQPKIIYGDLV